MFFFFFCCSKTALMVIYANSAIRGLVFFELLALKHFKPEQDNWESVPNSMDY